MQHKLITQHQHGFTIGRSCLTNLLTVLNDWTSALNNGIGTCTDVIFLDYQKTFDTVITVDRSKNWMRMGLRVVCYYGLKISLVSVHSKLS